MEDFPFAKSKGGTSQFIISNHGKHGSHPPSTRINDMNLHEYQAKQLFKDYGIPVLPWRIVESADEARDAADELGCPVIVKAQVHAGGRGKAGGVKFAATLQDAVDHASSMLGTRMVTHQTGPSGVPVNKVMITPAADIAHEYYLSIVMDGDEGAPAIIATREGGVEIEQIAEEHPEKIVRIIGDPLIGLLPYRARDAALALGFPPTLIRPASALIANAYRLFTDKDCSLVEINPLIETEDGKLLALDAKVAIEDDALFRHPDLRELHDPEQMDPLEREALEFDLAYVKLEGGRVGCMVNGAGLAMATMDITKWAGAEPANFLDIGGSADLDRIEHAFKIIVSDPDVEIILVNLFAGIARSDVVATGIINAATELGATKPIVVAMRGTNAEEGLQLLHESDMDITPAPDMASAAIVLRDKLASMEGDN